MRRPISTSLLVTWGVLVLTAGCGACDAGSGPPSDAGVGVEESAGVGGWLAVRGSEVLDEHSADLLLTPASVQKLVVAAAALHYLGPEFRISTRVYGDGSLEGGVLEGDLVLAGGADPSWSETFHERGWRWPLEQLTSQVEAAGVDHVAGELVLETSSVPGLRWPLARPASEVAFAFAAPISALAIDDNATWFEMSPGSALGAPARLRADGEVDVENQTRTVGPERHEKGTVELRPKWGQAGLAAVGEYPISEPSYRIAISAPDAVARVGEAWREVLLERGIEIKGATVERTTGISGKLLATFQSPPLRELIVPILRESHNWSAEMLLVVLAKEITGEGRIGEGLEVLEGFMEEIVGVGPRAFRPDDGSGLSPYNLVTPRAVVHLLDFVWRQSWRTEFVAALAGPGAGTLEVWPAMPRLKAKTGTIRDTIALAGFLGDPSSTEASPVIFVQIWNHELAERGVLRTRVARWVRSLARQ